MSQPARSIECRELALILRHEVDQALVAGQGGKIARTEGWSDVENKNISLSAFYNNAIGNILIVWKEIFSRKSIVKHVELSLAGKPQSSSGRQLTVSLKILRQLGIWILSFGIIVGLFVPILGGWFGWLKFSLEFSLRRSFCL